MLPLLLLVVGWWTQRREGSRYTSQQDKVLFVCNEEVLAELALPLRMQGCRPAAAGGCGGVGNDVSAAGGGRGAEGSTSVAGGKSCDASRRAAGHGYPFEL